MALKTTDIDRIFDTCIDPFGKGLITDQTVYYYCTSPFMVYCERFVPEDKKDPLTAYQKMVFEQSEIHRQCVIEKKYGRSKTVEYKTVEYRSQENGFKKLLEGMSEGVDVLCRLPAFYIPENLKGTFDILEKCTAEKSKFGGYHYVLKKIISAKEVKDHHKCQGAFLNYLLGKIQGYTPPIFYLIDRDYNEVPIGYRYCKNRLRTMLRRIRKIFDGKEITPIYGCKYPWETYSREKAIETHDVSLVCGIGQSKKGNLAKVKIKTVEDLVQANIGTITGIKGIGQKTAKEYSQKAKVLIDKNHICLNPYNFPKRKTEIFLDFEYMDEQLYFDEPVSINYLIGVVTRTSGKIEYKPFIAHQLDEEGEMFDQFVEWLLEHERSVIYHWSTPEKKRLEDLLDEYRFSEETRERVRRIIRENMIDLCKITTKSCVFPTYGDGLKEIGNYIGYEWKHADVDARECTALYFQYIENPRKHKAELQKILDYNEDDCRATIHIKDWLEENIP